MSTLSLKTKKVLSECMYFEGNLHGIARTYFYSGRLETESCYQHGKLIAQLDRKGVYRQWAENGELEKEVDLSREIALRQDQSAKNKSFFGFVYTVPVVGLFLRLGQWVLKKCQSLDLFNKCIQ